MNFKLLILFFGLLNFKRPVRVFFQVHYFEIIDVIFFEILIGLGNRTANLEYFRGFK
jgi:hypothetical protein